MAGQGRDTDQDDKALEVDGASAASAEGNEPDLETCLALIAQRQDQSAYAVLFRQIAPKVKAYLMRGGADAATAEDLAQETLARIWSKAGLYRPGIGNPEGWVLAMARNLRIDRIRKERVWELSDPFSDDHEAQAADEMPADERLGAQERERRVREALADLPAEQREVVVLSFIDGLSHSAIARRLDLSLGTVKSRLRLAYEKIRPVLAELR